jgi:NAD(P)H-quinone oxidoreductase subunit 5
MKTFLEGPLVVSGLAAAIPILFALAAILVRRSAPLQRATRVSGLAAGLACLVGVGLFSPGGSPEALPGLRLDVVTGVMLLLVTGLGLAILHYSRSYLAGDPGVARYTRWILITLSAVTTLVVTNNLLVLALAWTATSLSLHQLLTFYERPAALVAAHKKFLASRFADLLLILSLVLVDLTVGSLNLDRIASWVEAREALPTSMTLAAILFALAACVKSAQLPLHGWLTQVMEAPTPVSALLHAGIVNIGGFLMIRLAPLMVQAPLAQTLLVCVGLTTTVLAALVLKTRVSIKVALAWSTCAQMGFMLVQCGLGAWHLALLHLVAHSLYKAHAFLSSGSTVETWRAGELALPVKCSSPGRLALATSLALALVGGSCLAAVSLSGTRLDLASGVLALVVALALVPMLDRGLTGGLPTLRVAALRGLGVTGLYFLWHVAAAEVLPLPEATGLFVEGWILVGLGFVGLFAVQTAVQLRPESALARSLHRWLFAGLFLDERFTRLTFHLWPPRLGTSGARTPVAVEPLEA